MEMTMIEATRMTKGAFIACRFSQILGGMQLCEGCRLDCMEMFFWFGYNQPGGGIWQMKRNTNTWGHDTARTTGSFSLKGANSAQKFCSRRLLGRTRELQRRLPRITRCRSRQSM